MTVRCDDPPPSVGAFALVDDGARWAFTGGLTFDNAARVFEDAARLPLPASGDVDLSGLGAADSAALAVLIAIRRRARAEGRDVAFTGLPASVSSLARVYGVDDLVGA